MKTILQNGLSGNHCLFSLKRKAIWERIESAIDLVTSSRTGRQLISLSGVDGGGSILFLKNNFLSGFHEFAL